MTYHQVFWNAIDLTRKLEEFRTYYNAHRVHCSLDGATPSQRCGEPVRVLLNAPRMWVGPLELRKPHGQDLLRRHPSIPVFLD
jgi:hypothetical protein